MIIDEAKKIARWVAQNAWQESVFLSPEPMWIVNARSLLDFVSEEFNVSKEALSIEVQLAAIEKEQRERVK